MGSPGGTGSRLIESPTTTNATWSPGLKPNCSRINFGMTTAPFEETRAICTDFISGPPRGDVLDVPDMGNTSRKSITKPAFGYTS
jgi:hypothetical protein